MSSAPSARASRRTVPLKLRAYVPPEVDVHADIATAFARILIPQDQGGAVWTTIPIGHVKLTGKQAGRLAMLGVKPGWGDIIGFWQGGAYLLEVKKPGGTLSQTRIVRRRNGSPRLVIGQREVFPLLAAQGVIIGTAETVGEALACVRAWGWPMRRVS
jgi:hypothetical protein